jgi:lipopolysaccharide biosynthesis protein
VGLTESFDRGYHLQSSLLLVKGASAINALKDFFKKYPLENDRELIIVKGEIGLTQYFLSLGFRVNCYANLIDLIGLATETKKIKGLSSINSQHLFMEELFINMNIPFLKREALSQNPTHSNYDYSAIFQRMTIGQRELLMNALRFRV